ncbi:hypothetical protein M0804_004197 [Polistes exclamans]|nr:hypothetical protein M0804_004197 [Polistes exclamans]
MGFRYKEGNPDARVPHYLGIGYETGQFEQEANDRAFERKSIWLNDQAPDRNECQPQPQPPPSPLPQPLPLPLPPSPPPPLPTLHYP